MGHFRSNGHMIIQDVDLEQGVLSVEIHEEEDCESLIDEFGLLFAYKTEKK